MSERDMAKEIEAILSAGLKKSMADAEATGSFEDIAKAARFIQKFRDASLDENIELARVKPTRERLTPKPAPAVEDRDKPAGADDGW